MLTTNRKKVSVKLEETISCQSKLLVLDNNGGCLREKAQNIEVRESY